MLNAIFLLVEMALFEKNQKQIEQGLGNLSLRELADDSKINKIEEVLKSVVSRPQEIAKAITEEAKFWKSKLR